MAGTITISTFGSRADNVPSARVTTWPQLVRSLTNHRAQEQKDGALWSPAVYPPGVARAKDAVLQVECAAFDIDDGTEPDTLAYWLNDLEYVVSSTHSHRPERPKVRVVIQIAEPIPNAEFDDVWRRINHHLLHGHVDPSTKDSSRMFYVPTKPPDGPEPIAIHHTGKPLDWRTLPPLPKPKPLAKKSKSETNLSDDQRRAEQLLAKWEADLAAEPEGGRHHRVCQLGYAAGGLIASGLLDAHDVETKLFDACQANGLIGEDGERNVQRTLADTIEAGHSAPWIPDDLPDSPTWQARLRPRPDAHHDRRNGHGSAASAAVETISIQVTPLTGEAGAAVLDAVHSFLGRFVAYPSQHAHVAHTLWVAHTHLMDAWDSTPRMAFLSPEPSSGKTRALEITELLVPRPVLAVNVTAAYLFRKVGDGNGPPTILYDEIDTVFGPRAKENEDIRGLLNAGHRRGAVAGRCVVYGKRVETEEIPAYSAVALAGLGGLPDTILSRAVVIRMRRRAPGEHVEAYRRRIHQSDAAPIQDNLQQWAARVRPQIGQPWPRMPAQIADRDADAWEPLLAIADAAGDEWGARARAAAVSLVAESKASTPSLGVRLLADVRQVFGESSAMSTEELLSALVKLDEAPWGELDGGKPINARGLAQRLRQYGVSSKTVRVASGTPKGYTRADLWDAWQRYLPTAVSDGVSPSSDKRATSATSDTKVGGSTQNGGRLVADVSDTALFVADAQPEKHVDVADVADVAHLAEDGESVDAPDVEDDAEAF